MSLHHLLFDISGCFLCTSGFWSTNSLFFPYLSSPAEKGGGAAEEGAAGEAGAWDKTTAACPNSSSRRRPQASQPAAEPADTWRTAAGTQSHDRSLCGTHFNVTLVYVTQPTNEWT